MADTWSYSSDIGQRCRSWSSAMICGSASSRRRSFALEGFVANKSSVVGASFKERAKKRSSNKSKKPPPPSTDEIQGILMRDFAEGVILQDYAMPEFSETRKSLSKATPGSLSLNFKQIEERCESLPPKGSAPKVLEVRALITQNSDQNPYNLHSLRLLKCWLSEWRRRSGKRAWRRSTNANRNNTWSVGNGILSLYKSQSVSSYYNI